MKTALLALLAAGSWGTPQDPAANPVFTNYELGVTFNYPATWEYAADKNVHRFRFGIEGGAEKATLELYPANYRSDIDIWQATQKNISEQLKRTVVRQWQEEILGVPLLLTKSQGKEGGRETVSISGLVYSATPRKVVFRLAAPAEDFDKAEFEWRTVMQTMRTIDGTIPKPEDPNRQVTPEDLKPKTKPPKRVTWKAGAPDPATFVKAAQVLEAQAGGKSYLLRVPADWTVAPKDGGWTITKDGIQLELTLASSLDSAPPAAALMTLSGKTLEGFTKVAKREDTLPKLSRAGLTFARVWRTGSGKDGAIWSFDAVGQMSEAYWSVSGTRTGGDPKKDLVTLTELVQTIGLEPAS